VASVCAAQAAAAPEVRRDPLGRGRLAPDHRPLLASRTKQGPRRLPRSPADPPQRVRFDPAAPPPAGTFCRIVELECREIEEEFMKTGWTRRLAYWASCVATKVLKFFED
jgi:hypothetical protein